MSRKKTTKNQKPPSPHCVYCGASTTISCSDCLEPLCQKCAASTNPTLCPECQFFYSCEDIDDLEDEDEDEDEEEEIP